MNEPKIVIQGSHQGNDLAVCVNVINCDGVDFYFMLESFFKTIAMNHHPAELLLYKETIDEIIDKALGMDEREKGC